MAAVAENLDRLTRLPGRFAFDAEFPAALSGAVADGRPVSVGVIDVDLFGRVNGEQGRDAGDAVLRGLAEALGADAGEERRAYRFGGDAFAVVLEDCEKEQAFLELEALRKRLEGAVTVSIGVAAYPDDSDKPEELVNKACEALYRAKVSGRNKVCLSREEKMVTKTSHYTQGQLLGLRRLAEREAIGEAVLLREALNNLLRKYNA